MTRHVIKVVPGGALSLARTVYFAGMNKVGGAPTPKLERNPYNAIQYLDAASATRAAASLRRFYRRVGFPVTVRSERLEDVMPF